MEFRQHKLTMKVRTYYLTLFLLNVSLTLVSSNSKSQTVEISIDPSHRHQTIENFGASDAWSFQFLGRWPEEKKQAIADLLFSSDTTVAGQPKGIGLSLWRYNLGAGSAEQGANSGIADEWRRAPSFFNEDGTYDWNKKPGQTWFLNAAKIRGVNQFLGFFNSPPVALTKNGKAFSSDGKSNIEINRYPDFSKYIAETIKGIQQNTGILLNYISPVNEPQWDWKDGGQEGNPYTNEQIFSLVTSLNEKLESEKLTTKIIVPEAAQLEYLIAEKDKPNRDNQIAAFFDPRSANYIGDLNHVSKHIDGHSYFTTSPYAKSVALRKQLKAEVASANISYWMSEYCILGDNNGEINGNDRDLGINSALYMAKVIHSDLVNANATSWQWWTAVSAYNYKDGLIYIDKNKTDGNFYQSKMLWGLGNFSWFIKPGFHRIEAFSPWLSEKDTLLLVSAYQNKTNNNLVVVVINSDVKPITVRLNIKNTSIQQLKAYVTSATQNLKPGVKADNNGFYTIPARSIVTLTGNTN